MFSLFYNFGGCVVAHEVWIYFLGEFEYGPLVTLVLL